MPVFRLRTTAGQTQTITAGRVLVADGEVRFQSPGTGGTTTVASAPLGTVERVERRFNEADGRLRWSDEHAVNEAAGQARTAAAEDTSRASDDAPLALEDTSPAVDAGPQPSAAAAAPRDAGPASRAAAPPTAVSARDVRCPQCSEQEELSGRRADGQILLTCHACGYEGPRTAKRRCATCGGEDVVERPKALVERARGTQLSVVGYTTVGLCRTCDADDLAAALEHGGAVLPKELPTVDPQTLRLLGKGRRDG